MSKKTTKKALLMSALSLLLCFTMLIGTTFAWFSDSVSTGDNKIIAGNLDVDLQVERDGEWISVEGIDDLFDVELWEPGVVAYETFKAVNLGNLALKYNMYVGVSDKNYIDDTEYSLADVIKVAVIKGDAAANRSKMIEKVEDKLIPISFATLVEESILLPEEDQLYTVVAYWAPSNTDNNYNLNNGKTIDGKTAEEGAALSIDFSVTLAATQYTYEEDSYNKNYDKDATLSGPEAIQSVIGQGAKDANNAIVEAIKALFEESGEEVPENIAEIVYFDKDGLTYNEETEEQEITLHFDIDNADDAADYVNVTYDAVKALIGTAVDAQIGNIYSIQIAPDRRDARVLNGKSNGPDDIANWVEAELRAISNGLGGIQQALEAAVEFGIPVIITDMQGNAQTYRMLFDLGWVQD